MRVNNRERNKFLLSLLIQKLKKKKKKKILPTMKIIFTSRIIVQPKKSFLVLVNNIIYLENGTIPWIRCFFMNVFNV